MAPGGVRVRKVSCGFPEEALDAKLRNLLLILVGHMPERHILSGEQFGSFTNFTSLTF